MKNFYLIFLVVAVLVIGSVFVLRHQFSQQAVPGESAANKTSGQPVAGPQTSTSAHVPPTPISKNQGRVVFAVADVTAPLTNVQSIFLTVNRVSVHSATKGWIVVSQTPRVYDLLKLHAAGPVFELLAEAHLDAGMYEQIRLFVSSVVVVTKDGKNQEAKLPSQELTIAGTIVVLKGENSSATFDFEADKSLHLTGEGKYIFAPVVSVETRNTAGTIQIQTKNEILPNGRVDISGGTIRFSQTLGMNENGELKKDFRIDPTAHLEIVGSGKGNVIRIVPKSENGADIKVSAEFAIDTAVRGGYFDSALSIQTTTRNGVFVWRLVGLKNLLPVTVYVDVATGNVVGTE